MSAAAPSTAAPQDRLRVGGDDGLDRDAKTLHRALSELLRVYQFRDRDRICCHDISVSQCYALEAIVEHGPLALNELAERLYLDKSTASRVVSGLERKGYSTRTADPNDRRALRLAATAEGATLCRCIEDELIAEERRLLADFDPEVRQAMANLLSRLAAAATQRIGCGSETCCC